MVKRNWFGILLLSLFTANLVFAQGVGGRFFTGPGNARDHEIGSDGVTYLTVSPTGAITTSNSATMAVPDDATLTDPVVSNSLIFDETTADLTVTAANQSVASALSFPDQNGTTAGVVVGATCTLDATDGHTVAVGTSTCTIELPAGATLLDIQVQNVVLWDAGTSTTLQVGDDDDPNGWFDSPDLQSTDLLVGEVLSAMHGDLWGGVTGDYLVTATGQRGRTTAGVDSGNYLGAATEVVATAVTVGTVPTEGTTKITVFYVQPAQIAAAFVAS